MGEEIFEKLAQLQHENTKLLDELHHLKEHTFSVEESLNLQCAELSEEKRQLKSLEQQIISLKQLIKEKDKLIDSLQDDKKNVKQALAQFESENVSLKDSYWKERAKNKQMEMLKAEEENLRIAYNKLKEDHQTLKTELSLKCDECFSSAATVKELVTQVKELEEKISELVVMRDALLREKEERQKISENTECFCRRDPEKFRLQLYTQDKNTSASLDEGGKINLREELLEVELKEKEIIIDNLKGLIRTKEDDDLERNKIIEELRISLVSAGLNNCNFKIDDRIDSSAFYNIYNNLLRLINWPEGQTTECKLLTDVPALSVVGKDGVQTTQPSSARVIETISIASQTDPIKNLSPVLPFRTFEKLQSDLSQPRPDLDEEGEEPLSFIQNGRPQTLFCEPKNCDLDMDIYRSCRKLSVLPEEDVDESLIRKSSLKKPCGSNFNYFNLKIHSADDIRKIQALKPLLKETSSCSNVIPKSFKSAAVFESHRGVRFDVKIGSKADDKENNELELPIMSPRDVLRQPHSFDSYLDPLKARCPLLPRQTSDPTQNTVFAPLVTRRGSYIRRPKSTCRPLTLPCDKKKEERVCKVRFDLAGIPPKKVDAVTEKESPVLNNTKTIKMVSRFKVEIVDEVEFRKSLEENGRNATVTRKRPPLIHSVVYKKSPVGDLENFNEKPETPPSEPTESPMYDTATEDSPAGSTDADGSESNYPLKRRRHSDVSSYSFEDSQDSSEGNDILVKSIKLHTNSKCILMKELKKENSDSSCSNADAEIPFIDAEDLPVIKPSPDLLKITPVPEIQVPNVAVVTPGSPSDGSDAYLTPCDVTPVSENEAFGPPKSSGLSKSPTVLKNLANFELLAAISEARKPLQNVILEEDTEEQLEVISGGGDERQGDLVKTENDSLKRTSSDGSEASESETLTYGTVKSHLAGSSDCDSDTYVTVWSDKSFTFERKFSDLSENSSSPYNTPPDTSSASFCTPPDTYSPILNSAKRYSSLDRAGSDNVERKREEFPDNFHPPGKFMQETLNRHIGDGFQRVQQKVSDSYNVIFDSPKLEFYETNDSVENLEAFLQTEEGLTEPRERPDELENLTFFEPFGDTSSKRNSLDSPKLLERRGKKHPPLSRQNSTEEYNFLDPHDSCLNLSEEISSPSTTPDTSNKTVIFKNVPLTVSNTIDLEDDFPISEAEIQISFDGEISQKGEPPFFRYIKDGQCLSEPCTPSISSADFVEFSIPRKQRSSFTEESLMCGNADANLPEIIVSRLSSESESSGSEMAVCPDTDFASNVSDRSEVHLSDVNSISGQSDNGGSLSEHSDNVVSDVFSSDSDKSSAVSRDITRNSSSSPGSDKTPSNDNSAPDHPPDEAAVSRDDPPGETGLGVSDGQVSSNAKDMP